MTNPSDGRELLRTVHLHGALGARFGRRHRLAVASPVEAVRALSFQHPGFRSAIAEGSWRVVRGKMRSGLALAESEIGFNLGRGVDLHFVPVVAGAGGKSGGIGKIVAGIALAAGAFFLGPASLGLFGAGVTRAITGIGIAVALQGVSALLAPMPSTKAEENRQSFLFGGAENVSAQGGSVPVVIGRMRVGSVVISAGLAAEQQAA